jgi:hypothetical protein
LAEPHPGIVSTSVPLTRNGEQPEALASLVLDFDSDGRLTGIEIMGPADHTLRSELLKEVDPG